MPAQLNITRYIDNEIYFIKFQLALEALPEDDKNRIKKFGEPTIQVGGTLLTGTANEFTLPVEIVRVKSDLPYVFALDSKSPDFATGINVKATAVQDQFTAAYTAAFVALRAEVDSFTGQEIVNV